MLIRLSAQNFNVFFFMFIRPNKIILANLTHRFQRNKKYKQTRSILTNVHLEKKLVLFLNFVFYKIYTQKLGWTIFFVWTWSLPHSPVTLLEIMRLSWHPIFLSKLFWRKVIKCQKIPLEHGMYTVSFERDEIMPSNCCHIKLHCTVEHELSSYKTTVHCHT